MLVAIAYKRMNMEVKATGSGQAEVAAETRIYMKMLMGVGLSIAFMVLTWP